MAWRSASRRSGGASRVPAGRNRFGNLSGEWYAMAEPTNTGGGPLATGLRSTTHGTPPDADTATV